MQIAYYDESGDDGNPGSSPLFVLTALYMHFLGWKDCQSAIYDFRKWLKENFQIPIRMEIHSKGFILNKNPYRDLKISNSNRKAIIGLLCELVATLEVKVINVVIVKPKIVNATYDILDTALKYSVQRIENDINPALNPNRKFIIITDSGRVGKMRKVTRKIQKINYIPSKYSATAYRKEIKSLIEDPLPKDSKESYFIQLCDLIAHVVYNYAIKETKVGSYHGRLPGIVGDVDATIKDWMDRLKPIFNLNASSDNEYGIVFHPK